MLKKACRKPRQKNEQRKNKKEAPQVRLVVSLIVKCYYSKCCLKISVFWTFLKEVRDAPALIALGNLFFLRRTKNENSQDCFVCTFGKARQHSLAERGCSQSGIHLPLRGHLAGMVWSRIVGIGYKVDMQSDGSKESGKVREGEGGLNSILNVTSSFLKSVRELIFFWY